MLTSHDPGCLTRGSGADMAAPLPSPRLLWRAYLRTGAKGIVYRTLPPSPDNWWMELWWELVDDFGEERVESTLYEVVRSAAELFVDDWKSSTYGGGVYSNPDFFLRSSNKPSGVSHKIFYHTRPEYVEEEGAPRLDMLTDVTAQILTEIATAVQEE